MDHVPPLVRSRMMSQIRSTNTLPELIVRRHLYHAGYRYRLHVSSLPGRPDIVFVRRRICVFVHGCFWHGCPKCRDGRRRPKSNRAYWLAKIRRNRRRDRSHLRKLRSAGWKAFVIWECEIPGGRKLSQLERFIDREHKQPAVRPTAQLTYRHKVPGGCSRRTARRIDRCRPEP